MPNQGSDLSELIEDGLRKSSILSGQFCRDQCNATYIREDEGMDE